MNAREFAHTVVTSETLAGKLAPPPELGDAAFDDAGASLRLAAPGRPANLQIVPGRHTRVPPLAGMPRPPATRAILHALANHELQAIELFRVGGAGVPRHADRVSPRPPGDPRDEQRHLGLYIERLAAHGVGFGDQPVTGHFWNKLDHLTGPCELVCTMNLTFENANLDFAGDYAAAARAAGDEPTAAAIDQVPRRRDRPRPLRLGVGCAG